MPPPPHPMDRNPSPPIWITMSKALERSIAMVDILSGGQGLLKPWVILCARERRVDTVEWLGRKPCWWDERRSELISGCRMRSRTLKAGQRRKKGRYIVLKSAGLNFKGFGDRGYNSVFSSGGDIAEVE